MEENDDFPLQFHEALGEHTLTDGIRNAIIWAAISKFLSDHEVMNELDLEDFTDKDKELAKSVVFHGPFEDMQAAVIESQHRRGVVIAPRNLWTNENQPVWIACLAN